MEENPIQTQTLNFKTEERKSKTKESISTNVESKPRKLYKSAPRSLKQLSEGACTARSEYIADLKRKVNVGLTNKGSRFKYMGKTPIAVPKFNSQIVPGLSLEPCIKNFKQESTNQEFNTIHLSLLRQINDNQPFEIAFTRIMFFLFVKKGLDLISELEKRDEFKVIPW